MVRDPFHKFSSIVERSDVHKPLKFAILVYYVIRKWTELQKSKQPTVGVFSNTAFSFFGKELYATLRFSWESWRSLPRKAVGML